MVRRTGRRFVRVHQSFGFGKIHARLCRHIILQNVRLSDRPGGAFGSEQYRRAGTQWQKIFRRRHGRSRSRSESAPCV